MEIRVYPDPVLRRPAELASSIDDRLRKTVAEMFTVMKACRGVGLAGPQVGVSIQLLTVNLTGEDGDDAAFVNPAIVSSKGSEESEEGCLSFPGLYGNVRRAKRVTVHAYDLDGRECTMAAKGLAARAWQHELDHLAGVLFIDKMSPVSRMAIARNLDDMEAAFAKRNGQQATT